MKTQLKALMIVCLFFAVNRNVIADEKKEVDITIQANTSAEEREAIKRELLVELTKKWDAKYNYGHIFKNTKRVKQLESVKQYELDERPLYKLPTPEAKQCMKDLNISLKDMYVALVSDEQSSKCEATIAGKKEVRYGSEKNARALLLTDACKKFESAEKVKELEIKCEKYVPAKPYINVKE